VTNTGRCPACGRGQAQGLLCHADTTQIERDLTDVPQLLDQLHATLARQGRTETPATGGLAHERAGYHAGASDALTTLTRTLTAWSTGLGHPAWYATTAARNLRAHIDDIRAHPDADKLHREITTTTAEARRAIDQRANRTIIPVGPCPDCDGHVHAYIPTEDERPARMECDTNPTAHRWDTTQWLKAGRRILAKISATA
jgi:hypothetical protein